MTQGGGDPVIAAGGPITNGLMIAFAFTLPYHVMRTAAAAGLRVHVLGDGASRGLRRSRYCRSYRETQFAGDADALLAEIGELARLHAIDVVFPSDDVSTRLLATLDDRLPVRCATLPDVATFDLLNDKWNFTRLCLRNGVRAPRGWLLDSADSLRQALAGGDIELPITIKPTNRSGGVGVMHIREPGETASIDAVDYQPVLVQRHISGESVSITLLCDRGRVTAHVAQQRDAARFRVFVNADLLANVSRLAALTRYSGLANFDAVVSDDDGLSYLVECNPRFWYSIYLVMIAGLNFVDLALASAPSFAETATLDSGQFQLSLRRILTRPWQASRLDWRFLLYSLSDPVAFALQRAKSYDDSEVAVPVAQMIADDRFTRPVAARGRRRSADLAPAAAGKLR
jgi:biotin carboxylase